MYTYYAKFFAHRSCNNTRHDEVDGVFITIIAENSDFRGVNLCACPGANGRVFLQVQRMMDAGGGEGVVLQKKLSANLEQANEVVFHFYERF